MKKSDWYEVIHPNLWRILVDVGSYIGDLKEGDFFVFTGNSTYIIRDKKSILVNVSCIVCGTELIQSMPRKYNRICYRCKDSLKIKN